MSASISPSSPGGAGGGLTDAQLRATPVPVSGTVTVTDGSGPITVDGTVATTAADGALATVGTTTDAEAAGNGTLVALAKRLRTLLNGGLPAALAAGGGLKVEGVAGGVAQPVSGTVTANAGTGPFPVSDNAGSLTVDAPVGTPVAARLSDGTAFLTTTSGRLAVDASGVAVPITDNAGSLTVDAPVGTPVFVRLSDGSAAITNLAVNSAQISGTARSTGSRITDAGVTSTFQAAPTSANILVGQQAFTATTAATTVITIPSNRTWVGTITVTCDGANTGAVTTVGQALGTVTTTGANTVPAAGTVVTCEARWGANVAAGTVGTQGANSITVPMVVACGAASGTIALASTQAGTNSRVACIASGYLV